MIKNRIPSSAEKLLQSIDRVKEKVREKLSAAPIPERIRESLSNIEEKFRQVLTALERGEQTGATEQSTSDPAENIDWSPVIEVIKKGKDFLVTAHTNPDGDAVGSATALYGILKKMGKNPTLLDDKPYPEFLQFLPHTDELQTSLPPDKTFDASFICDCGSVSRVSKNFPPPERRGTLVIIDHHKTSEKEGDVVVNSPETAAVGLLIYQLARALQFPLDREIATSIYTSIVSDTGSFRYEKTTPYVLRTAAHLLELGVNPWEVACELYESMPAVRQKLLAKVLETLELHLNGQLALIYVTEEMLRDLNANLEITDGFINFARGIKGVEVAAFLSPRDGRWKVSFRSKGKVDVSEVALKLGGGGHHNAAGAFVDAELTEAKNIIIRAVAQHLPEKDSEANEGGPK